MSSRNASGLATVQSLYVLQVQLAEFLQRGIGPKKVKEAKQQLRQFNALLREADPAYMGGEDVYEGLETIRRDVSAKINRFSLRQKGRINSLR